MCRGSDSEQSDSDGSGTGGRPRAAAGGGKPPAGRKAPSSGEEDSSDTEFRRKARGAGRSQGLVDAKGPSVESEADLKPAKKAEAPGGLVDPSVDLLLFCKPGSGNGQPRLKARSPWWTIAPN